MTNEFEIHQDGDRADILLPAVLDLAAADKLWTSCSEAFEKNLNIVLKGADVERLTTGCVQVMLSASKTLETGGLTFQLDQPSEAVRAGLIDLGLNDFLEKWSTE